MSMHVGKPKYRTAYNNGLERGDALHFLGTALEEYGNAYLKRFEELIFGTVSAIDGERPELVPVTVSNITATGCTLAWTAPTVASGLKRYF